MPDKTQSRTNTQPRSCAGGADCRHAKLQFGSGDYYLFCQECKAAWVRKRLDSDIAAPELSNFGDGALLSGETRSCAGGAVSEEEVEAAAKAVNELRFRAFSSELMARAALEAAAKVRKEK